MKLTIEGHRLQMSPALNARVAEKLDGIFEKYFGNAVSTQVLFRRAGHGFLAHIETHVGKHIHLSSEGQAGDAYSAFDLSATRLAKRLRRHKRKLRDHYSGPDERKVLEARDFVLATAPEKDVAEKDIAEKDAAEEVTAPTVIAETPTLIPTLSVAEAVMHLDSSDQPALLFHNASHGSLNMLYQRTDGHLAWVDPQQH